MITYKFIYNRKNRLNKDGTAIVQLEIYKNRERKYISTGVIVDPGSWDDKNSKVTKSHPRAEEYNMTLHDLLQRIEAVLRKGKLMEKEYGIDDIVELINHDDSPSLYDFITNEVEKDLRITDKTKKDPPISAKIVKSVVFIVLLFSVLLFFVRIYFHHEESPVSMYPFED